MIGWGVGVVWLFFKGAFSSLHFTTYAALRRQGMLFCGSLNRRVLTFYLWEIWGPERKTRISLPTAPFYAADEKWFGRSETISSAPLPDPEPLATVASEHPRITDAEPPPDLRQQRVLYTLPMPVLSPLVGPSPSPNHGEWQETVLRTAGSTTHLWWSTAPTASCRQGL